MPAPCCPPSVPPQSLPTNLSVPSRRDSPGMVRGPGVVSRAGGSGRRQAAAAGLNLPASWTKTLDGTAELEHGAAPEKRLGLVALQVSTALPGPRPPPPRLLYRQGHPGRGLVTQGLVGRVTAGRLSPRSRRRRQQVGLPRASPARPGVGGSRATSPATRPHGWCGPLEAGPASWELGTSPPLVPLDGVRMTSGLESARRVWGTGLARVRRASAQGSLGEDGRSPDLREEAGLKTRGLGARPGAVPRRLQFSLPWKEVCACYHLHSVGG